MALGIITIIIKMMIVLRKVKYTIVFEIISLTVLCSLIHHNHRHHHFLMTVGCWPSGRSLGSPPSARLIAGAIQTFHWKFGRHARGALSLTFLSASREAGGRRGHVCDETIYATAQQQ